MYHTKKEIINNKDSNAILFFLMFYLIVYIYYVVVYNNYDIFNVLHNDNIIISLCFLYGFICRMDIKKLQERPQSTILNNLIIGVMMAIIPAIIIKFLPVYFKFLMPVVVYKSYNKIITFFI
jgi:hypothetical protein